MGGMRGGRRGALPRKLREWADRNPWKWLPVTVGITWAAIFAVWTSLFYYALTLTYKEFASGIDPERAQLVLVSGLVLASVVAPLFGLTWSLRLKRELAASRELADYVGRMDKEERKRREKDETISRTDPDSGTPP